MRPRIGISGCLLTSDTPLVAELGPYVEWVPYTAEIETGLGTLWETWRLTGQGRLVESVSVGSLPTPADLDGYLARGGSRYGFDRHGVFVRRLTAAFPLLPVADDLQLGVPTARERFIERIFATARLRGLFVQDWRPRDLVAFHTRHKLQILAHDPAGYQRAGRLVAYAGCRPQEEMETGYRRVFGKALAGVPTRGRNANAMRKISKRLSDPYRHEALDHIRAYERGDAPFDVPIAVLNRHTSRWAAEQTYLNPYPPVLRLRESALTR